MSLINSYEPINPSWIANWKLKLKRTRITSILIFSASLLPLIIYSIVSSITKEIDFNTNMWLIILFSCIALVGLFWMLIVLLSYKVRHRQCDGYNVLVYSGFKCYLVVEGEVQDSSHNRYLYGMLPNKKQIWASISASDGFIKIGIGEQCSEVHTI